MRFKKQVLVNIATHTMFQLSTLFSLYYKTLNDNKKGVSFYKNTVHSTSGQKGARSKGSLWTAQFGATPR